MKILWWRVWLVMCFSWVIFCIGLFVLSWDGYGLRMFRVSC